MGAQRSTRALARELCQVGKRAVPHPRLDRARSCTVDPDHEYASGGRATLLALLPTLPTLPTLLPTSDPHERRHQSQGCHRQPPGRNEHARILSDLGVCAADDRGDGRRFAHRWPATAACVSTRARRWTHSRKVPANLRCKKIVSGGGARMKPSRTTSSKPASRARAARRELPKSYTPGCRMGSPTRTIRSASACAWRGICAGSSPRTPPGIPGPSRNRAVPGDPSRDRTGNWRSSGRSA